jgi:tRNA pseudouridine38-40 synthase
MRTIKLTIAYDGTNYVGWQRQPNGVSVQERLEEAVERMSGVRSAVVGAGRTDAGVHALGQVAHFMTESRIPSESFARGLNGLLPPDIAVLAAEEMPEGFHARHSARGKIYRYLLLDSCRRAPLLHNRCWQLREALDVEAMRRAAAMLVGERDFASFRAAGCGSRHAVRRLDRIEIAIMRDDEALASWGGGGRLVAMEFEGEGFVRHMIRNIVGTIVDCGRGELDPENMPQILAAAEREQAGRCAPACGLYLVRVIA